MATVTATDFLVATGTPGLWVRLHNNVSGTDYYSTAVSDPQGAFTYTVPTGEYSLYVGSAATVPGTPTLRNGHFQVAVRNGDDAALNSGTFQSTGPYGAFLPGAPTIPTPAGVSTGQVWDWGGMAYNAKAANVKGDGVTNDNAAIQAVMDAHSIVEFPPGAYLFTNLTYHYNSRLKGSGATGVGAGGALTQFSQISGTASPFMQSDGAAALSGVIVEDIYFHCFNNQTSNTGGLLFTATSALQCNRVQLGYFKNFGFKVVGGATGGDCQNPTFLSCIDVNAAAGSFAYHFLSSTNSSADGANMIDCWSSASDTWVRIDKGTTARGYGAEVFMTANRLLGQTSSTVINADGIIHAINNRFEVVAGGATLTVSIGNNATLTSPSGFFFGNTYAAPGGLTWTDNGLGQAIRVADSGPVTGSFVNYFPIGAMTHSTQSIAYAAAITPDAAYGDIKLIGTLTGAITINNPTHLTLGQVITYILTMDGTGGRAVTFGALHKTAWVPDPTAGAISVISFVYDGTNLQQFAHTLPSSGGATWLPGALEIKGQRISKDGTVGGALQLQDNSANGIIFLNAAGNANILAVDNSGNTSVLGHVISTTAGTPSTSALGANVTSVTFTGNDTRGTIAIVMSAGLAANTRIATCTFAASYGATAPTVLMVNETAGVGLTIVNFYRSAFSTGVSFDIASDQALVAGTYTVAYHVIG